MGSKPRAVHFALERTPWIHHLHPMGRVAFKLARFCLLVLGTGLFMVCLCVGCSRLPKTTHKGPLDREEAVALAKTEFSKFNSRYGPLGDYSIEAIDDPKWGNRLSKGKWVVVFRRHLGYPGSDPIMFVDKMTGRVDVSHGM
jgi:hypothetical protein